MKKLLACLTLLILIVSCKSKKKTGEEKNFFATLKFLQGQVRELETGNHSLTKIETADGHSDTAAITKSQLAAYTNDFVSLPDIGSEEHRDNYQETSTYDESMNNAFMTYTTNDSTETVRSESVLLQPENGDTRPSTVLINTIENAGDSSVVKDMTWHVGKRFQVVTKTSRSGQPERIRTVIIKWD